MVVLDASQLQFSPSPVVLPRRQGAPPAAARRAVSTLFFVNGALFATWASRIPAVQAARGLNEGELGLVLLALASGAILAMPLAGWLTSRFGSDKVSKLSALICCVSLPVLVLAPNLLVFVALLFAFGVCNGILDVAMNAQAVAVEKVYKRPIMSSFHALWSTGGIIGATAGGFLAGTALGLLAHFALLASVMGAATALAVPHLLPQASGAGDGTPAGPTFRWPAAGLLALGAVALCVMLGEGAMSDWSAVYLRHNLGTSEGLAAAGYAAFSIAMALGRYGGDFLCTRFGAVKLVRTGGLLSAGGLSLALGCGSVPVAVGGFACVGLGFATLVPLVFSAAGHRPGIAPGVALASVTTLGYMGFLIGPPLIGMAGECFGLRCGLGLIVGTSLLSAALAPVLQRGG